MSIPPSNLDILHNLYNAGISGAAFNLEIFKRDYAIKLMPGKGRIAKENYIYTFKEAVKIWGKKEM